MSKVGIERSQKSTPRPDVSYKELPRQVPNQSHSTNNQSAIIHVDKESDIIKFLNGVDNIQLVIERIDKFTEEIKKIYVTMREPMANSNLEQELDNKTEEIKRLFYEISTKLEKMHQSLEYQSGFDIKNAQRRIKESQLFALTWHFNKTIIEYKKEAFSHRERCLKEISRVLEIHRCRINSDELEEIPDDGCPKTFPSTMSMLQRAQQLSNKAEAHYRDIIKLEASVTDSNWFRDLPNLVADQGDMVDSIEHNVSITMDYVEVPAKDVQRIKKTKIILFVNILLASLIFILYYYIF
ncbi:unnamed protein product [Adineta steineri]|uniref:t-SNARE coiled-coil homology domain-containing protein n=1 Tax=Adineta steineri TaxID=433720 RepID=A0A815FGF2_9BILA|nr:unnamed protein product [Adineta steineri]CAF1328287.1 unnamed protein product [Adineta steineri]